MPEPISCLSSSSPLQLVQSSVFVSINGWLADVAYSLTYENSTSDTLKDVRFVFPVDDSSSVYMLVAELNGRTIECECREKSEAEETYNKAVAEGFAAAFAAETEDTSDLMDFYLGNVAPKDYVKIRMRSLIQLEAPGRGVAVLTIPRVLSHRYKPQKSQKRSTKAAPVEATGVAQSWLMELQLRGRVTGGSASVRHVRCNQGSLSWIPGQEEFSVTKLVGPDCDIELSVEFELPTSGALLLRECGASEGPDLFRQEVATLSCFFDEVQLQETRESPKEFVIVVDCSGSMTGGKIKAAKEALLLFLKSLPRGCHFNVICFGSSFTKLYESSQEYTETRLRTALELQESMKADMGGTEILKPLKWLFGCRKKGCHTRVILLTDGEVSNVDEVKELVRKSCSDGSGTRAFAIGIGHGASTSLVKGVARVGRGRADFVRDRDTSQLRRSVIGLLKTAQVASVDDLRLSAVTPDGRSVLLGTVPSSLPVDEVILSPLNVALVLTTEAAGQTVKVTVTANLGFRELKVECDAAVPLEAPTFVSREEDNETTPSTQLLHREVARRQLKEWTDDNYLGQHTGNIVELSKVTNLASACTAFIGIEKESKLQLEIGLGLLRQADELMEYSLGFCGMAFDGGCFGLPSSRAGRSKSNIDALARSRRSKSLFSLKAPSLNLFGKKSKSSGDIVLRIVSWQQFDGSWDISPELLKVLGLTRANVESAAPDKLPLSVWVTALVCEHLKTRQRQRKAEWELLMVKAMEFIESFGDSKDLLDKARSLIDSQSAGATAASKIAAIWNRTFAPSQ